MQKYNEHVLRELTGFLKRQRVLTQFKKELKSAGYSMQNTVEYPKERIIRGAFVWSQTEKGYDFWSKISKKWGLYIAEKIFLKGHF